MTAPDLRPAALDEQALSRIRSLEETLGGPLVAYEPESTYAHLTPDQLAALQTTEEDLGVRLVAYRG